MTWIGVSALGTLRYWEDMAAGEFSDVDHWGGGNVVEEFCLLRLQGCEMPEHGEDFDEFPAPVGFPALGAFMVEFTGYFAGGMVAAVGEPTVEHVAPARGVIAHAWSDTGEDAAFDDKSLDFAIKADGRRELIGRNFSGVRDLGV